MCGNVAIIDFTAQGLWNPDAEMFFHMLLLNSMRGFDSTGVAGIRRDRDVDIVKSVGDPFSLMWAPGFTDFKSRVSTQYSALLGHGRLATKGKVTPSNAHPFRRGAITLIHNGTLSNFAELKKDYEDGDKAFQVDSDLCANHIDRYGVEAFEKFEGAFAFIWYDNRDHKVRAIRNNDRPLYIMEKMEYMKQFYISSDPNIFEYVKAKGNFKGNWKSLPAGEMAEFDLAKKEMEVTTVKFYKKIWPVHTGYKPPMHTPYADAENDYWDMHNRVVQQQANIIDAEIVETKTRPLIKEISKLEQGNVTLEVGQKINFTFVNYSDKEDTNTAEQWAIVEGVAIVDMPVEVRGKYTGNINDIIEASVLQGTISSIVPYDAAHQYVCRLWLKNIARIVDMSPMAEDELDEIEGKEDRLELWDKTTIPRWRFMELSKTSCVCGLGILPVQSKNCLVAQGILYCPACTLAGKYPKNA